MNAIRAVIVDDEPLARRGIRQLLAPHTDIEVAGEARNGREAVRMLEALAPDLVFLDVQMPELDGFAVLRRLRPDRWPAVVFVTAHDAFAVRAFEAHALDYLVKPVHEARFEQALARVRERMRSDEALALSQRLSTLLADGFDPLPPIAAPRPLAIGATGGGLIFDPSEIAWIEADDYYAAVHARGKRHLVRESLASLQRRLDPAHFVRVHRRAIVNLAQVRGLQSGEDGGVLLRDGTVVPLSRRRREQVAEAVRCFAVFPPLKKGE